MACGVPSAGRPAQCAVKKGWRLTTIGIPDGRLGLPGDVELS
jgi:hypothetical protein